MKIHRTFAFIRYHPPAECKIPRFCFNQLFLREHSRVKLYFTPTHSSWLNQVELWFSKIELDLIARGIFTSVKEECCDAVGLRINFVDFSLGGQRNFIKWCRRFRDFAYMNLQMNLAPVIFFAPWMVMGVLAWFAADMRSILKSKSLKHQLSIDGKWGELEQYYKRASKTYRPFVWFHQRYLLPGTVSALYAIFLYQQGRLDEALVKVDQAIRQINGKPRIFRSIFRSATFTTLCSSLRARTLILTGLGRYDEARKTADELRHLTGTNEPNALALLELYCGRLDEALAIAEPASTEDKQYDAMRAVTALAYDSKGEFDKAIHALLYEPSDVSKFYSPEGLKVMNESPEGSKIVELQRRKHSGVFQPARLILLAQVYVSKGEFENADGALDEAEKSMGSEPDIQASYCRHRARSLAAQGKVIETEKCIERMRAIARDRPKRSLLWETHYATGQSYLFLGRFKDALAELIEAQRSVLHPIEKHATAYWIARVHEAAGNRSEAIHYYQMVADDTIPSWMRKGAVETLARLRT